MEQYKRNFIEVLLYKEALCFGEFTLKSGRVSPYFLNMGKINCGDSLSHIAIAYAEHIEGMVGEGLQYDGLFGPAYKGIQLATSTAIYLKSNNKWAYNRKEEKDHGEGGTIIGTPIEPGTKWLILDDVITAGTAAQESWGLLHRHGATCAGMVVGLDRQERGTDTKLSAVQAVKEWSALDPFEVSAIVTLDDLIWYASREPRLQKHADDMNTYREQWGTAI